MLFASIVASIVSIGMSVDHDRSPSLSTAAESDIVGYSAVSPAAIVALFLGLASFFAVGNLLLLIVPALALIAAATALAQIARGEGSVSGRWAAVAGLSLALLFASTAIARRVTRAAQLRSEAHAFADAWLKLVREGRLEQAHQWHMRADERQLPNTSLAQFYHDSKPAQEQLHQFFQAAPLSRVVAAPSDAKLQYSRVVEQLAMNKSDRVALLYVLREKNAGVAKDIEFVVVTERTPNKSGGGSWQIAAVAEPAAEATP